MLMDDITLASHIVRDGRVGHLMWFAAIQQLFTPNIIGPAGSLCECGMPSFPPRLQSSDRLDQVSRP